jgi:hypothetical protein
MPKRNYSELLDPAEVYKYELICYRTVIHYVKLITFIFCRLDLVRELYNSGRLEQTCTQETSSKNSVRFIRSGVAVGIGKVSGLIYFF